jgi:hypothetical protein
MRGNSTGIHVEFAITSIHVHCIGAGDSVAATKVGAVAYLGYQLECQMSIIKRMRPT